MRALTMLVCLTSTMSLEAAPRVTLADWVGDYRGKLTWSAQCTVEGAREATLAVAAIDGVTTIDLAPARPGLRRMSLSSHEATWTGRDGEVAVTLVRRQPGTVQITVEIDSGCRMTAQLTRPVAKVAACEALVGWARVEATCGARRSARSEDLVKLMATTWKPADAAQCTARADRLELALVDAGCAPHPDPEIGTRLGECLALSQAVGRLQRCAKIPAERLRAIESVAQSLRTAAAQASSPTLRMTVAQQCSDTREMVSEIAAYFHCQ